jgi:hypothetical protein
MTPPGKVQTAPPLSLMGVEGARDGVEVHERRGVFAP